MIRVFFTLIRTGFKYDDLISDSLQNINDLTREK